MTANNQRIKDQCDAICDMLLAKRSLYGDSALSPLRVFSKASTDEQLLVRIDDKISRIARGKEASEDVLLDLVGYLILLLVSRGTQKT